MNKNMKKTIIFSIIILIIAASSSFYGGMIYAQSKSRNNFQERFQQTGVPSNGEKVNNFQNSGFVSGEIISKDNESITVKLKNGGSKIIFYSDSTEIKKMADALIEDIDIGKNVNINGDANQDGSIIAKLIQITD